mmetsp:Transcript_29121/g.44746  ORF Transcript_29121/g.44746 Transcript_29121/m.44746 type:complete len:209 (+) Transcript_29121:321-947(+)
MRRNTRHTRHGLVGSPLCGYDPRRLDRSGRRVLRQWKFHCICRGSGCRGTVHPSALRYYFFWIRLRRDAPQARPTGGWSANRESQFQHDRADTRIPCHSGWVGTTIHRISGCVARSDAARVWLSYLCQFLWLGAQPNQSCFHDLCQFSRKSNVQRRFWWSVACQGTQRERRYAGWNHVLWRNWLYQPSYSARLYSCERSASIYSNNYL